MIRVARAELLKLRTTPGPWVVLGVGVVLTALFVLFAFVNPHSGHGGSAFRAPVTTPDLRRLVGAGYEAAVLMAPILGVLCITSEYRYKVITTTLLNTPRRSLVLVAKAVASVAFALFMAVICLALVAAMGLPWLSAQGGSISDALRQVGPVVPGLFADFALMAVFGLGIGVLLKNQVAGVLLIIAGIFVLEPLIYELFLHLVHVDLNWLPSYAAASVAGNLTRSSGDSGGPVELSWWTGTLVLLAWGLGPAIIGYFVTFNRDVT